MSRLIRTNAEIGRVVWRQHALARMFERGISRAEVIATLKIGEVIEYYGADKPFPSYLMFLPGNQPLHVVVALDPEDEICHVITAYHPDREHFENDLKTRKPR